MEHQVLQDGKVVDATISYIKCLGPAHEKTALDFFRKTKNISYKNIHGVVNSAIVRNIYRRVPE